MKVALATELNVKHFPCLFLIIFPYPLWQDYLQFKHVIQVQPGY